jgi:co-chaperonin GroES (HSP10)
MAIRCNAGKYDGAELRYNDENHQLIKDDDVLLKYTGDEPTVDNVECIKDQILVELPPKEDSTVDGLIISTASNTEKRPDLGRISSFQMNEGAYSVVHGALVRCVCRTYWCL